MSNSLTTIPSPYRTKTADQILASVVDFVSEFLKQDTSSRLNYHTDRDKEKCDLIYMHRFRDRRLVAFMSGLESVTARAQFHRDLYHRASRRILNAVGDRQGSTQ
jgi:hypothetical protein